MLLRERDADISVFTDSIIEPNIPKNEQKGEKTDKMSEKVIKSEEEDNKGNKKAELSKKDEKHEKRLRNVRKALWYDDEHNGIKTEYLYVGPYTICIASSDSRSNIFGIGVAKWNPNDKGKGKWDYNAETGRKYSKPRAMANLAESLIEWFDEQHEISQCTIPEKPVIEIQAGHLVRDVKNNRLFGVVAPI